MADLPELSFPSAAAWAAWLEEHHATSPGLWLRLARAGSGVPSVTYAEAVDEALCWGWIDGQKRGVDDGWWLQKFTRRRPRSVWAKLNRERVERLLAAGKMRPPGLAEVDAARADGRWDAAYDPPSTSAVPEDLQAALDAVPEAAAFFRTLNATNRYSILHRVQTAKKPETRAARIEKFVAMLAKGETLH